MAARVTTPTSRLEPGSEVMPDVRRTGFTLMEVVVALAVAAIAVVGLLRLHMLSMAAADKADKTAQALVIAQNKIAELEAQGSPTAGHNPVP